MSTPIHSFAIIYNNPFIFSPLFSTFYSSTLPEAKKLLIVLPDFTAGTLSNIQDVFDQRKIKQLDPDIL